uniref:AB hydrolase-1 domain-containing protein n=1 Tax=Chenopodium quinoa TaxID=63459 RepID=A0A803MZ99_CHEQI
MLKNVGVIVLIVIMVTSILQYNLPPSPRICGLLGGPSITAPRVKLRDGRYLAYKETGVPKENAKFKIIFVHGFGGSRHSVAVAAYLPWEVVEELGLYIVSFDRPGYGESDPDPKRTLKSMAFDIEELADQLKLGNKFYLIGYSMGGHAVWEDQWAQRVVHYIPWLTYWWNTQKLFPGSSVAAGKAVLSEQDIEIKHKKIKLRADHMGDDDFLVPFTLQRYIAQKLPWIQYHELAGAGHLFPYAEGMAEAILSSMLLGEK